MGPIGEYYQGDEINEQFVNFYKNLLGTQAPTVPINNPQELFINKLPPEMAYNMVREVTSEEIKKAMFSIENDKAPGPDGYTSKFFKSTWDITGGDVCMAIKEFFSNGRLLTQVNAAILSLVPKKSEPKAVGDFRPIACCNVLYKCITKIICERMKEGLGLIIDECQSAFVPGRMICDNILLTQELVRNYQRKRGEKKVALKIDLQKAYDSVDHEFLRQCLVMFGFHDKMTKWIMACITTA